jgi:hypothetical protein
MRVPVALAACAVLLACGIMARAQQPAARPTIDKASTADPEFSLGQMTPTPEMWFYQQAQRQYRDPKMAVRKRAEFEADQRQVRLASQRWFGYSNSRPIANPIPYTGGTYSPMWTSNSPYSWQWRGVSRTSIIVVPQGSQSSAGYGLW